MNAILVLVFLAALVISVPVQSAAKTTIKFWHYFGDTRTALVDEVVKRFEEKYPYIDVVPELKPFGDMGDKTLLALMSGSAYDVMMITGREMPGYASAGLLVPIDKWADARGVTQKFFANEIAAAQVNGRLYGLVNPPGGASSLIYYNNRLLGEAGMSGPPSTWQTLRAAARKLTKLTADGRMDVLGFDPIYSTVYAECFLNYLYNNDGTYLTPDYQTVAFSNDKGMEAIEFISDLVQNTTSWSWADRAAWTQAQKDAPSAFKTEKLAMIVNPAALFYQVRSAVPNLDFGITTMPYNSERPGASTKGLNTGAWTYAIPASVPEDKREAAYLFIEWFTASDEGAKWFLIQQARPSAVRAHNLDAAYYKANPFMDIIVRSLETGVYIRQ